MDVELHGVIKEVLQGIEVVKCEEKAFERLSALLYETEVNKVTQKPCFALGGSIATRQLSGRDMGV